MVKWDFYIITLVILVVLVLFYIKEAKYNLFIVTISLLFAGALGNFIDRVFNGEVVDFIDTYIFGYDFPILI